MAVLENLLKLSEISQSLTGTGPVPGSLGNLLKILKNRKYLSVLGRFSSWQLFKNFVDKHKIGTRAPLF